MEYSNAFVVGLGLGTVFAGLICLVFVTKITSFICTRLVKKEKEAPAAQPPVNQVAAPAMDAPIADKQQLIAAISAAIAEDMGCGVEGIRIKSIKRI